MGWRSEARSTPASARTWTAAAAAAAATSAGPRRTRGQRRAARRRVPHRRRATAGVGQYDDRPRARAAVRRGRPILDVDARAGGDGEGVGAVERERCAQRRMVRRRRRRLRRGTLDPAGVHRRQRRAPAANSAPALAPRVGGDVAAEPAHVELEPLARAHAHRLDAEEGRRVVPKGEAAAEQRGRRRRVRVEARRRAVVERERGVAGGVGGRRDAGGGAVGEECGRRR